LRSLFFTSPFYPEHIEQLVYELEKIKDYRYKGSTIDTYYLLNLEKYLDEISTVEKRRKKKREYLRLKGQFTTISNLADKLKHELSKQATALGSTPIRQNPALTTLYNALANEVGKFIGLFKSIHNL